MLYKVRQNSEKNGGDQFASLRNILMQVRQQKRDNRLRNRDQNINPFSASNNPEKYSLGEGKGFTIDPESVKKTYVHAAKPLYSITESDGEEEDEEGEAEQDEEEGEQELEDEDGEDEIVEQPDQAIFQENAGKKQESEVVTIEDSNSENE